MHDNLSHSDLGEKKKKKKKNIYIYIVSLQNQILKMQIAFTSALLTFIILTRQTGLSGEKSSECYPQRNSHLTVHFYLILLQNL